MDRLRGVSKTDIESIAEITNDPESTIVKALNVWTTSVMTMPWFRVNVHAGNLLVLEDERVGFINFGLVGRVGEKILKAVNELSISLATADYEGIAEDLLNMGATDGEVNTKKFVKDVEDPMSKIEGMQTDVTITGMADGSVTGAIGFDEDKITNVLLEMVEVTEDNGLKLPREFGLLVKQSLYFDRYLKILAPDLDGVSDSRVELGSTDSLTLPSIDEKNSEIVIDV